MFLQAFLLDENQTVISSVPVTSNTEVVFLCGKCVHLCGLSAVFVGMGGLVKNTMSGDLKAKIVKSNFWLFDLKNVRTDAVKAPGPEALIYRSCHQFPLHKFTEAGCQHFLLD